MEQGALYPGLFSSTQPSAYSWAVCIDAKVGPPARAQYENALARVPGHLLASSTLVVRMVRVTERRFYIWISFLPLALPLVAGAIALPAINTEGGPPTRLIKFASVIFLSGVFSTVPYAIVLAVMFWRLRAAGHINFRRLVWSLPLWICLGFAPVFTAASGSEGGVRGFAEAMLVGGLWAFIVGCCYAILIESLRFIATRLGWITSPRDRLGPGVTVPYSRY